MDEGTIEEQELVEGFGNEVLYSILTVFIMIGPFLYLVWQNRHRAFQAVHPAQQLLVNEARRRLFSAQSSSTTEQNADANAAQPGGLPYTNMDGTSNGSAPDGSAELHRVYNTDDCPICLNPLRFAVETNCGHMFCGECITAYWRYGNWLGAINCAVCRATVTILLVSFQEADVTEPGREVILEEVRQYNRRFSGEPRPLMDYLRDVPVLLPHLASQFFSVSGLIMMFRLRVIMCVFFAFVYILSPLDILPEAVFGIIGLLDDLFVIFLFAIYISLAYRQFITGNT